MRAPTASLSPATRWLTIFCLWLMAAAAWAQAPSQESLQALETAVTADSELTDETRAGLLEQLSAAQAQLDKAREQGESAANFQATIDEVDQRTSAFENKLRLAQENPEDLSRLAAVDASTEEIEGQIRLVTAEREALGERRSQLLKEMDELPARRSAIQQRLVELQSRTAPTPPQGGESVELSLEQEVAAALGMARRQAEVAEQQALELEVLSEAARTRISSAERAWLGHAIDIAEARLASLASALEQARANAAEQRLETTAALEEKLQNEDPALQAFAAENRRLTKRLQEIAGETDRARAEGSKIRMQLESIEEDSTLMHRRLKVTGRKEVLGRLMISRLDSLPDTKSIQRSITERNQLIADTSLSVIYVEEDFRALNERKDYVRNLVPGLDQRDQGTRELVDKLVDQRGRLLQEHITDTGTLLRQLLDNNDSSNELITASTEFHRFLLGNLLWIQNFSYFNPAILGEQLTTLFSPSNWALVPAQLLSGYRDQDWSTLLLLLFVGALILRRQLQPIYERQLSQPLLLSGATIWQMLAGLLLSALLVLPWPLLLLMLGYFLETAQPPSRLSDALGPALMFTARILYGLLFVRQIIGRLGVGRRFLKWDARMLDSLRSELNWAGPLVCVSVLLDAFAFHLDVGASGGSLGALTTAVIAGTVVSASYRLLRQDIFSDDPMLRLTLRLSLIIAAVVIIMQLLGLLFAAEIYLMALGRTAMVLVLIKIIGDTLERWLLIMRARLERKHREEQEALSADDETGEAAAEVDLSSLSEAHRKLLSLVRLVAIGVAIFLIWSPSLPALKLADAVTLWEVADASGGADALRAVTLFDLLLSVLILVVTGLLTRHLPSISEVFMREWFDMAAGTRYASGILLQYLVIAIGGSMFLTTIGWEWGKVQWLVAAMGVGIGFGLQEIVANFISGIIILFERPVRVGDIISAGGAEGTVKKINPRATIIETFDRKEHLIPNKELITGQVINWTLSDAAVRIIIPVGVAYGSDTRTAMALMLEAAAEVDTVLSDPEPRASFEDFGDNALTLWLRCFASEDRVGTWTQLRTLIDEKFKAAGIVIAFPQRDLHLDTLEPLQVEIHQP